MAEETLRGVIGKPRIGGDSRVRINADVCLIVVLIGVGFLIRITTPLYNTISVDESNMILLGKQFLASDFSQRSTTWMLSSYLYPLMAALLSAIGGLEGLRIFSAGLNALAMTYIYLGTRRLFGVSAAVWATLLFGFSTISLNLGQLAIGDSLALPMLCISFYCVIMASQESPEQVDLYLLSASAAFIIAVLAKYLLLVYLPALVLLAVILLLRRGWSASPTLTPLLGPIIVAFILFSIRDYTNSALALGQYFSETGDRVRMLHSIWDDAGLPVLFGLAGIMMLPYASLPHSSILRRRMHQIIWLLMPLLLLSLFSLPLLILIFGSTRNLWENLLPTLALTAPLAGYGIAYVIERIRTAQGHGNVAFRVAGLIITIAALWWIASVATARNWGWQHSWPNVERTVAYLEQQRPEEGHQVLAEGSSVYQFYLQNQGSQSTTWYSTWSFSYQDRQGVDALQLAIQDHFFQRVILDGYYTPGITAQLIPTLQNAGYRLTFEDTQLLSTGPITIQIYERSEIR